MKKRIAPAAVNALKDALTTVYWYKSDLRSFLTQSLSDPTLLGRLDWGDYKRNIVGRLVDHLAQNEDRYQDALLRLMLDVAGITDFSHLLRLDAGEEKTARAREAIRALNQFVAMHREFLAEQEAAEMSRQAAYEDRLRHQAVRTSLEHLRTEFHAVVGPATPQERGYKLEHVIRQVFELFDLDPKASFRIVGEQIDGAFTFDNTDYLLEAKWQKDPVDLRDLDSSGAR